MRGVGTQTLEQLHTKDELPRKDMLSWSRTAFYLRPDFGEENRNCNSINNDMTLEYYKPYCKFLMARPRYLGLLLRREAHF